jgi:WD40 repeat protein
VELDDRPHEIRIEYFQLAGGAWVRLSWAQKDGFAMQPVPAPFLFHDRAAAEKAFLPQPTLVQIEGVRDFLGHAGGAESVAFLPGGHQFVTGGFDGTTKLWDVATGKQLHSLTTNQGSRVWAVAVSPDGRQALATGRDAVVLWDLATGKEVRRFPNDTAVVERLAFSPDGRHFVSSTDILGSARLWEVKTGEVRKLPGPHAFPGFAWRADGKSIVGRSFDRVLAVWDMATTREIWQDRLPGDEPLSRLTLSPDEAWLAVGCSGPVGAVRLLSRVGDGFAQRWVVRPTLAVPGSVPAGLEQVEGKQRYQPAVMGVAFDPTGRFFASANSLIDNQGTTSFFLRFWDPRTSLEVGRVDGVRGEIRGLAFTPNNSREQGAPLLLVTVAYSPDRSVRLWKITEKPPPAARSPQEK